LKNQHNGGEGHEPSHENEPEHEHERDRERSKHAMKHPWLGARPRFCPVFVQDDPFFELEHARHVLWHAR
jgi:hypothetical protein